MPKRTDIKKILIIGSGPIVIGQACEFDYSGTQACKALRAEGYEVVLVNSNPATIMTDPELADRTYIEPLTRGISRTDHRARKAGRAAAHRRRPDRLEPCRGAGRKRRARKIRRRVDRRVAARDQGGRGPAVVQGRLPQDRPRRAGIGAGEQRAGRAEACRPARLSRGDPAVVHAGRDGRLDRLQPRGVCRSHRARAGRQPGARSAGRRIGAGLEGIRARSDARFSRQLRGDLLDRKLRSHGRAHRRFDHRGARADADRQGIPAHARRRGGDHPRSRRRDRRLEHPVRHRSGDGPHGRDRDEPARFAQLGAGLQGHRLSRSPKSRRAWRWA